MLSALAPSAPFAQARRTRIGMLGPSPVSISVYAGSILQGFAQLGYRDGERATFEYRAAEGRLNLYAKQARELVGLNCDLYIPIGAEPPLRLLQELRPAAPIVFLAIDYDPVEKRVVSDLRRPDRNTTGVYVPQNAMVAKRLEMMREVLPQAKRIIVFADHFSADQVVAARKGAEHTRFEATIVQFERQPYDYEGAIGAARKAEVEAFMNLASPVFARDRQTIAQLLRKYGMPSIGSNPQQAVAGYLLSLNANTAKVGLRVADVGVRLLKGAKPAEIPVEQADEFEVVVNAGTAKALGVRMPESIIARATRVIQ